MPIKTCPAGQTYRIIRIDYFDSMIALCYFEKYDIGGYMNKKLDFSSHKKRFAKAANNNRYRHKKVQIRWLEAQGFSAGDYEPVEEDKTIDVASLWARAKSLCEWCGQKLSLEDAGQDHLIPLSKGGSNSADNIVLSCSNCNTRKATKHPARFAAEQKAQGISTDLIEAYLEKYKNNPGVQLILSEEFND